MYSDWQTLLEWWTSLSSVRLTAALILPLTLFAVRRRLARGATTGIVKLLSKFGLNVDQESSEVLVPALRGLIVLFGLHISVEIIDVPHAVAETVLLVIKSFIVCFVFWLLNSLIQTLLAQSEDFGWRSDRFIGSWATKIARLILIALMVIMVLNLWNIRLGSALTGIGVVGAAAALAAQDFFRNIVAGFSIAEEKRFREGDWIRLSPDLEGIVEKVDLRSTLVRRFDKGIEHIPNSELAYKTMSNFSHRPERRLLWKVPLRIDTSSEDLNAVCGEIERFISESEYFSRNPTSHPTVRLHEFSESSIEMLVNCYIAANDYDFELNARHQLILATKKALETHGIAFSYPVRTLEFMNDDSAEDH